MGAMSEIGGVFFSLAFIGGAILLYLLISCGIAAQAVCRAIFAPIGTHKGAGCGSCGHELASLRDERCPECGANLLKSGVTTRRGLIRARGSLSAAILGWSYLAMVISIFVSFGILLLAASSAGSSPDKKPYNIPINTFEPLQFKYDEAGFAEAAPNFRVTLEHNIYQTANLTQYGGSLKMKLTREQREVVIEFADVFSEQWTIRGPDGQEIADGDRLESRMPRLAFEAVGFDLATEPLIESYEQPMIELAKYALTTPANYTFFYRTRHKSPEYGEYQLMYTGGQNTVVEEAAEPVQWLPITLLGCSVLFWLGGMILIIRRRSRLIEGPRAAALAA